MPPIAPTPAPVPPGRGQCLAGEGRSVHKGAELEQRAIESAELLGNGRQFWYRRVRGRRLSNAGANRSGPEAQFEESASDELVVLGL